MNVLRTPAARSPAIEVTGLTRRFGDLLAVDGVDLSVPAGVVYGFLGRNGAGKTTLIRMLLGLIRPSRGEVTLLGRRVHSGGGADGPWARVGYLVEGPGLYPELTVSDHLQIARCYHRLSPTAAAAVVDRLGLGPYRRVRARALSLGNRQRLGLALALVHRPDLLVLDEPGNGLDPAGVVEVRALLRELAASGVTVFMSSHLVSEVARTADRVGVIHRGRLLEELDAGRMAALGAARLQATLPTPEQVRAAVAALVAAGYSATAEDAVVLTSDRAAIEHPEEVATVLVRSGTPPRSLSVVRDDLERHFLRLTEER